MIENLAWRLLPPGIEEPQPSSWLRFVAFFIWHSLRAGVQVAAIALRPRPKLQPTLVEFATMLPPGAPRLILVGALSLMPGSLAVRREGERPCLHVLDRQAPILDEARRVETAVNRLFAAQRALAHNDGKS